MRISFGGSLSYLEPLVLEITSNDAHLFPSSYAPQGYNTMEVICIGAGGGPGGGIDTNNTGTLIRSYGGAGGGGGFHRIKCLISEAPFDCPSIIGLGGQPGENHDSDPGLTTDGEDGGYTSFGGTFCRASGGKGGKRVQSNSMTVTTQADGGEGGIGDSVTAGGGASGGVAGVPSETDMGSGGNSAQDGSLVDNIGEGGGGGAGGLTKYDATTLIGNSATDGGRGSYSPTDLSVYGPKGIANNDPGNPAYVVGIANIIPGGGGGAKATPLNNRPANFGRSRSLYWQGDNGIVVVRFTVE